MPTSSPRLEFVGLLQQTNLSGKVVEARSIYATQELIIGRDRDRCDIVIDDPVVSNKHLRIYTILYENNNSNSVAPLVYAEDLSRNGTYWNKSLIGKGNGGFLLSDGDTLRVSRRTHFTFQRCILDEEGEPFDLTQEREMKKFEKEYLITDRLLGAGAYGRVHMAIEQYRRIQLACKIVDLRKFIGTRRTPIGRWESPAAAEDIDTRDQVAKVRSWSWRHNKANYLDERLKTYHREAEILASISHPNIIGLEKVFISDNSIYIFQDLVTAGDLFSYVELKNGKLLDVEVAVIVRQITIALNFLHHRNIVHRDLKPDNILMTTLAVGSRVVLTDFGCARTIKHERTRMETFMGTFEYTAPEVFGDIRLKSTKRGYTKAVDMWSLGCVAVVLLTGNYPFIDATTGEYVAELAREGDLQELENRKEWVDVGSRPKEFVRRLLVLDERRRITAKDALEHPWFTNDANKTDFEELYQRSIKHWKPRRPKIPVIEVIKGEGRSIKNILPFQNDAPPKSRRKGYNPVEPPYIPFPRRMSQPFFPVRKATPFMSDDVKTAINSNWNLNKDTSKEEDKLPSSSRSNSDMPSLQNVGRYHAFHSEPLGKPPTPVKSSSPRRLFKVLRGPGTGMPISEGTQVGKEADTKHAAPNGLRIRSRSLRSFSPSAWDHETARQKIEASTKTSMDMKPPDRSANPRSLSISHQSLNHAQRLTDPADSSSSITPSMNETSRTVVPVEASRDLALTLDGRLSPELTMPSSIEQISKGELVSVAEPEFQTAPMTFESSTAGSTSSDKGIAESPSRGGNKNEAHKETLSHKWCGANIGAKLRSPSEPISQRLGKAFSGSKRRRKSSMFDFQDDDEELSLHQAKKAKNLAEARLSIDLKENWAPVVSCQCQIQQESGSGLNERKDSLSSYGD